MTNLEIRALLRRVDSRKLRQDAGIRAVTVARALGLRSHVLSALESGRHLPHTQAALRWVALVAALDRKARFDAELRAERLGEAA